MALATPRRSSTRISGVEQRTGAADACADSAAAGNASAMNSPTAPSAAGACAPAWLRRHRCTRLAFKPCACAIAATDAPGTSHSARTAVFNSALWRRRGKFLKFIKRPSELDGRHPCHRASNYQRDFAGPLPS